METFRFHNVEVFRDGTVIRVTDGKLLKGNDDHHGYRRVEVINSDGWKRIYGIHQLVAMGFIPNPESKPFVNHKDGVKDNNHIDNLEWCTQSENMWHASRMGKLHGDRHVLSGDEVDELVRLRCLGLTIPQIAKQMDISYPRMKRLVKKHSSKIEEMKDSQEPSQNYINLVN